MVKINNKEKGLTARTEKLIYFIDVHLQQFATEKNLYHYALCNQYYCNCSLYINYIFGDV